MVFRTYWNNNDMITIKDYKIHLNITVIQPLITYEAEAWML